MARPWCSLVSPIQHRMDRGMHYLTNLHLLSIRQGWTIRIVHRTIQRTYNAHIESGWRQFEPWSLTKIIDCRIVTITIKVSPFSLYIECHTPVLDRHRYERKHIHHLTIQQPRWTWRTWNNNPEASITRGAQCRWLLLPRYTQYSGSNIADCPVFYSNILDSNPRIDWISKTFVKSIK